MVNEFINNATEDTFYAYDAAGNLTAIDKRTNGGSTMDRGRFGYDLLNHRTSMNDPDAGVWSYEYDLAGNMSRQVDARGEAITFQYDDLNRLTEKRRESNNSLLAQYTFDQTPVANVLYSGSPPVAKGRASTATGFDDQGNQTVDTVSAYLPSGEIVGHRVTVPSTASTTGVNGTYAFGYDYDNAGHLRATQLPADASANLGETITTTFSSTSGVPTALSSSTGTSLVAGSTYNDAGQLTGQTLGGTTAAPKLTRALTYSATTLRLATLKAGAGTNTTNRQNLAYTYDLVGNPTKVIDTQNASQRLCYQYDGINRLTAAFTGDDNCTAVNMVRGSGTFNHSDLAEPGNASPDRSYEYSTEGNVLKGQGAAYTYSAANPHSPATVGVDSFAYDANGARTAALGSNPTLYGYDVQGRMTVAAASASTSTYTYDAGGNRVTRREGSTTTLFLEGGSYQATSVNGGAQTVAVQYSIGSQRVAVKKGSALSFELADPLGSAAVATDANGATPVYQRYYPFGGLRPNAAGLPTNDGFLGKPQDTATGLDQVGARYYDPKLGQFISPDPIMDTGNPQTLNPFSYAINSPLSHSDPTGLVSGSFDGGLWAVCDLPGASMDVCKNRPTSGEHVTSAVTDVVNESKTGKTESGKRLSDDEKSWAYMFRLGYFTVGNQRALTEACSHAATQLQSTACSVAMGKDVETLSERYGVKGDFDPFGDAFDFVVAHRHGLIDFGIGIAAVACASTVACGAVMIAGAGAHIGSDLWADDSQNISIASAVVRTGTAFGAGKLCGVVFSQGCGIHAGGLSGTGGYPIPSLVVSRAGGAGQRIFAGVVLANVQAARYALNQLVP